MTFGEHLEELRRRLIFCILYLVVGVGLCFGFGTELLQWTLGPHYRAIEGAKRDRLVKRMSKMVARFDDLTQAVPGGGDARAGKEAGGFDEVVHWEVLFARDVIIHRMEDRLRAPILDFATAVEQSLKTLPAEERAGLVTGIRDFARSFPGTLRRELAEDLDMGYEGGILGRLEKLEEKLLKVEEKVGQTGAQKAIGWGEDLARVLDPLREFMEFLRRQREDTLKSTVSNEELRERVESAKWPQLVHEEIAGIEESADEILEAKTSSLMAISYLENVYAYLKVAVYFGIVLTIPFILYELWKFVGAGLYTHEQKWVVLFLPFSLALFFGGALFGYGIMIPVGLEFLASWGLAEVNLSITVGDYVSLFFTLTLILGLVFQTPLVMIFLNRIGVFPVAAMRKWRRMAVFGGICLAIVMTPPDPFSWSLMALPMILLYEVGILLCDWLERSGEEAKGEKGREAGRGTGTSATTSAR
jgi:Tat protein translocase TatC